MPMQNEMEILWPGSTKLDDETLFILTYQYHTEKDPDDPAGKRTLREKSRYRMVGRIEKIKDLESRVYELRRDEKRLEPWKWPDDTSWDGLIVYSKDATNLGRANFIRNKISKAISWDDFLNLTSGLKKDTSPKSPTYGKYAVLNRKAVRDMKGYTCTNGDVIDVDDKEALLAHVGQTVIKEIRMKLAGQKIRR